MAAAGEPAGPSGRKLLFLGEDPRPLDVPRHREASVSPAEERSLEPRERLPSRVQSARLAPAGPTAARARRGQS